jgi:hypothetical protein
VDLISAAGWRLREGTFMLEVLWVEVLDPRRGGLEGAEVELRVDGYG